MEKWKDEIIDSLEGIQRAQPPTDAFLKIRKKINDEKATSSKQWIAVAASVVLVLCANIFFISNYSTQSTTENQEDAYPSIVTNFNIYE